MTDERIKTSHKPHSKLGVLPILASVSYIIPPNRLPSNHPPFELNGLEVRSGHQWGQWSEPSPDTCAFVSMLAGEVKSGCRITGDGDETEEKVKKTWGVSMFCERMHAAEFLFHVICKSLIQMLTLTMLFHADLPKSDWDILKWKHTPFFSETNHIRPQPNNGLLRF